MSKLTLTFFTVVTALAGIGCSHNDRSTASSSETVATTPSSGDESVCGESQVFFASGSAELDDAARARLARFATCLTNHEIDTIYVAGMTDPAGDEETNLSLGRTRARAVADYLREQGCTTQFVIRSYGEEGSLQSQPLWPLERSATVTAVAESS
ncbi:MAG: OmpA family protein [Deltaproteobacteria bacterium]|nr:OmpA family protein [Deltaproteobacteria bacterium]